MREAIQRELDRGGQVFFVHNRVADIEHVAARACATLVPEARVAVGHGQMGEDELEQVMLDFVGGEYDVLVCTTIIESGPRHPERRTRSIVDAPTASAWPSCTSSAAASAAASSAPTRICCTAAGRRSR